MRHWRTAVTLFGVVAIALACSGGGENTVVIDEVSVDPRLEKLTLLAEKFELASDDQLDDLIVREVVATSEDQSWEHKKCIKAMESILDTPRQERNNAIAKGWSDCPSTCPPPGKADAFFAALEDVEPTDRAEKVLEKCDAHGDEPVFDGDMKKLRGHMAWYDYLVYRLIFERLDVQLEKIEGPDAEKLQVRFDNQAERVARQLAKSRADVPKGSKAKGKGKGKRPGASPENKPRSKGGR